MTAKRPKLEGRDPFTVPDAAKFVHTDPDCGCEPKRIVVNPTGLAIEVYMHRPATQRGRVKRQSLIRKPRENR